MVCCVCIYIYLDNDIEPVRVVLFDLLELRCRVAPGKLDVDIGGTQFLGQIHLQSPGSGHDYVGSTVETEELRKAETGRSSTEHEDGGAELGGNLFEAVSCARGRLDQGGFDVGEIVDPEDLAGRVGTVFRKPTVHLDQVSIKKRNKKKGNL